jgi:hypothetical protein
MEANMNRIMLLTVVAGLTSCKGTVEDSVECQNEESAVNRVQTDFNPDFQVELEFSADDLGLEREDPTTLDEEQGPALREHIEAWDCLDLSWWNPSAPQKVVQVWTDETECSLYERASVEYLACDSHQGDEDLYRDVDEDGLYATEGDCDDEDAFTYPDAEEVCDEVDNNCDGMIDENLDCDDFANLN